MYKKILIPTDGSNLSDSAVRHGLDLAAESRAQVVVLTVTTPFHILALDPAMISDTAADYEKSVTSHAAAILERAKCAATAKNVKCETVHVERDHPYEAIIQVAAVKGCDAILMASHGRRGATAVILGSETVKVLTHSKLPVIVYR